MTNSYRNNICKIKYDSMVCRQGGQCGEVPESYDKQCHDNDLTEHC